MRGKVSIIAATLGLSSGAVEAEVLTFAWANASRSAVLRLDEALIDSFGNFAQSAVQTYFGQGDGLSFSVVRAPDLQVSLFLPTGYPFPGGTHTNGFLSTPMSGRVAQDRSHVVGWGGTATFPQTPFPGNVIFGGDFSGSSFRLVSGPTNVATVNTGAQLVGAPPLGASSANPHLPSNNGGSPFQFHGNGTNGIAWYDPIVATGYDFVASDTTTKFSTVTIADVYGDGLFDLFLFNEGTQSFEDSGIDLRTGLTTSFASLGFAGGVDRFSVRGIETNAEVDPNDPLGFVTGLSFVGGTGGTANFTMTALVVDTDAVSVPEPVTLYSGFCGFLSILYLRARLSRRGIFRSAYLSEAENASRS